MQERPPRLLLQMGIDRAGIVVMSFLVVSFLFSNIVLDSLVILKYQFFREREVGIHPTCMVQRCMLFGRWERTPKPEPQKNKEHGPKREHMHMNDFLGMLPTCSHTITLLSFLVVDLQAIISSHFANHLSFHLVNLELESYEVCRRRRHKTP